MIARLNAATWLIVAMHATTYADDRRAEIGIGAAFDVLGSYDVGHELGGPAVGNDLGPGTLGVVVYGGVRVHPDVTIGGEAELGIGGLVRTDERYFGGRSGVGSTLAVHAKLLGGWRVVRRGAWVGSLGLDVGIERLSEATGAGSVRLDSIAGGPWVGVALGPVVLQLQFDVHVPVHATIGTQDSGDPSGVFVSGGVRAMYVFGVGPRLAPADH